MKTRYPSAKVWVCKKDCGHIYRSPLPIGANAHDCPKEKGKNVDSIPWQEPDDLACDPGKKRVASPSSTEAPKSREETDMATTRAEPKPKAAAKPKAPAKPKAEKATKAESTEKKGRRSMGGRGWLASEVEKILRKRPLETITVGDIGKSITNVEGEHPSTGAVAAVIIRWGEAGYIKVKSERPMSFNGFTAKWKDSSLDAFLAVEKDKRAKARAAAKG